MNVKDFKPSRKSIPVRVRRIRTLIERLEAHLRIDPDEYRAMGTPRDALMQLSAEIRVLQDQCMGLPK